MLPLSSKQDRSECNSGFILVPVLVMLVFLAASLTNLGYIGHQASTKATMLEQEIRGRIVTSSAIRRVLSALRDINDSLEIEILSSEKPFDWQFGEKPIQLAIEAEGSKINAATTQMAVIERYINNTLLSTSDKAAILHLIRSMRRDRNQTQSIDALQTYLLTDMSLKEFQQDFTSFAIEGIDPIYASERVLRAIPDLTNDKIKIVLSNRKTDPNKLNGLSSYFVRSKQFLTIVASTQVSKQRWFTKRVHVEISQSGNIKVLSSF